MLVMIGRSEVDPQPKTRDRDVPGQRHPCAGPRPGAHGFGSFCRNKRKPRRVVGPSAGPAKPRQVGWHGQWPRTLLLSSLYVFSNELLTIPESAASGEAGGNRATSSRTKQRWILRLKGVICHDPALIGNPGSQFGDSSPSGEVGMELHGSLVDPAGALAIDGG